MSLLACLVCPLCSGQVQIRSSILSECAGCIGKQPYVVLQIHTHPPRVSRNGGVRSLSPLGVGSSASICAIAAAALMSASCAYGKNTLCPCSPVGSVLPGASAMRARLHVELPQPHCNRPRCMSNFGSHAPVLFLDRTNSPQRRPPCQHVQIKAHSIAPKGPRMSSSFFIAIR